MTTTAMDAARRAGTTDAELEQAVKTRLDEIVATNKLPVLRFRHWMGEAWRVEYNWPKAPSYMTVHVATRAAVDEWATFLGAKVEEETKVWDHTSKPGVWSIVRIARAVAAEWMPGVELTIKWEELRYANPPQPVRAGRPRRKTTTGGAA